MSTFLTVLAVIGVIILVCALLGWAVVVWFVDIDWGWRVRLFYSVASVIGLAMLVAFTIDSGLISDDNASHCGEGTRFVEESYYSPATKTTITDWMCVV